MNRRKETTLAVAIVTAMSLLLATAFPPHVAAAVAQQQRTAPPGTLINVRITQDIGSEINQIGDPVYADLVEPVVSGGRIVFPVGSQVRGVVKNVQSPSRGQRNGSIEFVFNRIVTPDGESYGIVANLEGASRYTKSSWKRRLVTLAIATGAGILVSKLFGGSVLRGVMLGGAAGTGYVLYSEGSEITIPAGTEINLILEEQVNVSYDFNTADTKGSGTLETQPSDTGSPAEDDVVDARESRFADAAVQPFASDSLANGPSASVLLSDGSRFVGKFKGVTDDGKIHVGQQYGELRIPFADIDQVIFDENVNLDVARSNDDAVLLRNGNVMRGYFRGVSEGKLVLSTQYGESRIPIQDIARIVFGE